MAAHNIAAGGLREEVIEHRVRLSVVETAVIRIDKAMDRLLWAILGVLATTAGTLFVLLWKGKP
jgi:hypothetical protein